MNSPLPEPFLPLYLDNTMVSTFRSCRRKFYHSFVLGLNASGRNIHLIAGGAFAAGLDAARKAAFIESADHDAQLISAFRAFSTEWRNNFPEVETLDFFEGENKSFTNTFSALEAYLHHYPILKDEIQPLRYPDGAPTVEFSFAIPLEEATRHPVERTPFTYVGRFDMLGEWNKMPVIVDEKTTTALGPTWLNQWPLRSQFMGYCWACQQYGYPVDHAFVRGVALLKRSFNFLTAPVSFPNYLLERWYTELLHTVSEIVSAYEKSLTGDLSGFGYSFGEACASYGGCSFARICTSREAEKWYPDYSIYRWNPLHKGAE